MVTSDNKLVRKPVNTRFSYILFVWLFLAALPVRAEYFRHLTLGDGLSQPSVMAIAQDKLGRMWIGTREGINVYDGVGITAYKGWTTQTANHERKWIGNEVNSIVTDSIGNIFMLIDNNLIKYDLADDHFIPITTHSQVMALAENKGDIIFVAHDSVFVKKSCSTRPAFAFTVPDANDLTKLAADDTNFYLSTPRGLYIYNRNDGSNRRLLPDIDIFSSFVARDGTLYIATVNNGGLYRLRRDETTPVAVSMPTPPEGVLGAGQCRYAIEDHNGKIWYGTFSGLFCYDPVSNETRHIKIPLNIGGLTHQSVFGLTCDRKGNIWVGTYYGGVNYFSPSYDKFRNYDYNGFSSTELSNSFVKDLAVDRNGHLWFATDGAGVGCLDENWNVITHLFTQSQGKALRQNNIRCMEYDPEGNRLFIGTHLGGLSIYDIDRQKVTNFIDYPIYRNTPGNIIHELKIHDGKLFISSHTGISWMDLSTGVIHKINSDVVAPLMDIDNDGDLYCLTRISRIILKISDPTSERPVIDTISNDPGLFPTKLCAISNGLLVSTLGNGLVCFSDNGSQRRLINTSNSRLPDDYCYAIQPGNGDNIYVTTANNVVKLNLADLSMQTVKFADFFPESHIINECALLCLNNDEILVGSTKGITRLNDSNFNTSANNDDAPEIFFSRLRLQNKEVTADDGSGVLSTALPFSNGITLPSNHNDVTFIIGVRDYLATTGAPEIEYRMDGIDSRWLTAAGNEISYQSLPSGNYKLRVRQHEGEEIALNVTVATPWYNSWWAWLLYFAAALAAGCFIIHKTLVAARLRHSLKKEKTERAQIEKLNQEKFVFFTNVSHEFQTPLTLIISYVDLLISRYKRHPKLIESLTRIRAQSEQMSHLITQLLEFRKLQQNRQVLRVGMHDANEILRETATPFVDYAAKREIDFTIKTSPDNPRGAYDPALLNRVLVNIISNAFKYTPDGGKISCSVNYTPTGKVVFEVEDTGRGIDEKDLPYIFDRFYNGTVEELKRYNVDYRSTGIGLAFAKSIVDKHHGTITVRSQQGVGTAFSVIIPGSLSVFEGDENVVIETPSVYSPTDESESINPDTTPEHKPQAESFENSDAPESPADETDFDDNPATEADSQTDLPLLLIVEDNGELRANLTEFFGTYFRIAEATDGVEGLRKARELTPDIIISDVMMPRMSGTEMCRTIKTDINLCHIPVILLTALSTSESKLEGLNTHADDYVTKPFESTLLLARVDNLLRLRRILCKQFDKQPVDEVDMSIVNPLDRKLLKQTTEIIEKHIADPDFDIPQLCREVGVSRSLFFNKFKALTGMTPNAFILNYRLKHAAALLKAQPHLTVADVADQSGFATAIYFSRCFRKQFGVSPVNYRKGSTDSDDYEAIGD